MEANNHKSELLGQVFPAELEEIKQRRVQLSLDSEALHGTPSTRLGLVGLALSGGGIRSASFSLGVIQGLSHHGLLRFVDYLSTVSGGGYIGGCLSSLLNDPNYRPENPTFPLAYRMGTGEPPALTQLRNSSNYLSPRGLLNKLRLPNLLLRGILLNLFAFLPFIMAAVFLTEVAYEEGPNWDNLPRLVLPLVLAFVLMAIAFPFVERLMCSKFSWNLRNAYELCLTFPLLLAIYVLAAVPLLRLTRLAIEHSWQQVFDWLDVLGPNELWKWLIALVMVVIVFMLAGKASENVVKLRGKVILLLVGLLGPVIVFGIFLLLSLIQIDSPFLSVDYCRVLNERAGVTATCPADLHDKKLYYKGDKDLNYKDLQEAFRGRNLPPDAAGTVRILERKSEWDNTTPVWEISSLSGEKVAYTIERVSFRSLKMEGADLALFDGWRDWVFVIVFLGLFLFNRHLLDVNITSPHGFYRDRLSKAFLFQVGQDGEIVPNDLQILSDLNGVGTAAPYHLINVAMNLQGSNDPYLRGRRADFFFFSKRYTGSERTGFTKTRNMEEYDRHLNLATAVAISGAAAAPNMGTTTHKSLVFIMTLLNIRLGYWLPNPRFVKKDFWFKKLRLGGVPPSLVWKEALGRLDVKSKRVNVSDGGHIENLGIYPLLQRRCKFIIAVDGEADPTMTFNGLVTLMRYARIDMGVEIDMNLDGLRKNQEGLSKDHWVLGKIHYSDGETGYLLYAKLSVSGDEPEYIRAYRNHNPQYPHESTADQFFSEDQFEAYRALGEHICRNMLHKGSTIGEFRGLLTA